MIAVKDTGKALELILPKERIKARLIDRISYASDAGFYYLQPQAIVQPVNESEIVSLFTFSLQHKIPLTFRTAGTSLSGQSITDGILVDLFKYWDKIAIEEKGSRVRVQPGITGAKVNHYLKKYNRKIGPDPSSIDAAMIGGILSNNASGMCCGVPFNSYHTTKHFRFILPDGKVFSTENKNDYSRFETECHELYSTLEDLKKQINNDTVLQERIRYKYQTKNTVGYGLNSFLDYDHPLDILSHLLIGAEGTLGFISEAVMETIPDYPCKATSLLYFEDIFAACKAIVPLTLSGAQAVELMDRASLRSIENIPGVPGRLKTLPANAAALLVEFQGNTFDDVRHKIELLLPLAKSFSLLDELKFTEDPFEQAFLWKLRKGMFPAVGAVRASGTTVILEDIAFPVDQLGNAILDLQTLFHKYEYHNAIIFGHAKDGNIHFVITQTFNIPSEVDRYDRFMREVVDMVVKKYDGTLKAEHGTGRNMAPFVETEWGSDAYRLMKKIKAVIDPQNLLNPGVIINENKNAHIQHLKELPGVEQEVDKCIECGYCEHVCPSRNITTTPRRRIVIRRALANLKSEGKKKEFNTLLDQFQYDGLDTCAVDGLCAAACPVDINTGDLVKRLRSENHNGFSNSIAMMIARNFKMTTAVLSFALRSGSFVNYVFGKFAMKRFTGAIKKIIPAFPLWSNQLQVTKSKTRLAKYRSTDPPGDLQIVYFPTCISRVMGGSNDNKKSITDTFLSIAAKAGINVLIPENIQSNCCGQIFSSKGFTKAYAYTANKTFEELWEISGEGNLPVVVDASSCTYTFQHCRLVLNSINKERFDKLRIIDSVDFIHDYILPRVKKDEKKQRIVLHPVCSLPKLGLDRKFFTVAGHFSEIVEVPVYAGCCGMAGDRGFLFPELTASATALEARDVKPTEYDGYYSSAKTCEMAMSDAVGKNYESILYLVDECM
ncbi:MAG TPA: FAD-binding and (Fe-S)-binding domain-containing protein [Chitinophagaceae bacterium]|nr:FAD-binding and (Fe-S)-binding domain-containing protein [Chitinophagaceae bacterium]